jgi:hypothetical protein
VVASAARAENVTAKTKAKVKRHRSMEVQEG